jgi:hypothetical protein
MKYKMRQTTLRGTHGGEVLGWVRPRLSEGESAALQESLIERRYEHLDEYLARIDECLRELSDLGAINVDTVGAIYEAQAKLRKLHPG